MKLLAAMSLLCCSGAFSQSQSPSWLHPSRAEFRAVADAGYDNKPSINDGRSAFMPPELNDLSRIVAIGIVPPLRCAFLLGKKSAENLEDRPTDDLISRTCDGVIRVEVDEDTLSLRESWKAVLIADGQRIEPTTFDDDKLPSVETYTARSRPWTTEELKAIATGQTDPLRDVQILDQTGYHYLRFFYFNLSGRIPTSLVIRYSDGLTPGSHALDVGVLQQGESAITPAASSK
jgi:hypothetical protein